MFKALVIFLLCSAAYADDALQQWRRKAGEIRQLAENDTPRAYQEARRLQAALPGDATPADRARALNLLARIEVYWAQTEQAALHIQQARTLAQQHDDPVGQAEADLNDALNAINEANIDAAIAAAIHAVAVLDGVDRPDLLGEALLRMAMMYRRTDQIDDSITLSMQALSIAKQNNDPIALLYGYQGLAIAYEHSARYTEARDYYQLMREQARTAGSIRLEAQALLGLGHAYGNLGDTQKGGQAIHDAIAIFRATDSPFSINFAQFALAENLRLQRRYAETLPIFDEILARYQRYPNKIGLWWTLNARSGDLLALGKIADAHRDVEQAYALAKVIGLPLYLTDSAKRLAEIAAAQGNHRKAYQLMLEAATMATQKAKDNAATRMSQLAHRYQTESKQREIDKLNRRSQQQAEELTHRSLEQRWLWTILGGSVVMLVSSALFLLRLERSHRKLATLNNEIQLAKNKLQATLDAIPDLMFEVGLDGRYYDCHSPQTELLAAPIEQLLDHTVADIMPAEPAAVCLAALREAHERGMSMGRQMLLPLPHGDFWFELSIAGKPRVAGEEPRFIVMSRDITARKQLEAQALQREQEFRVLVENSPDLIFRYDRQCRRIYVNPAVAQLIGKASDGLLDKTPSEAAILSAEEASKLMRMIRQVLASGLPAENEVECLSADGQLHYFHNRYAPEFDAHGEVASVISIARDITERKQSEQRLWLLDFALNQIGEAVYIIDQQDYRFLDVNAEACRSLGYSSEELLALTVYDIDPDADPNEMENLQRDIDTSQLHVFERRHKTKDGRIFPVEINAKVFYYQGRPTSIALVRDITERKRVENEIRALNANLEQRVQERTEELRQQTRYLRTLIDTLPMLAWLKDNESRFLVVNQATAQACDHYADDMIGKTDLDFWPHALAAGYRADDARVMAGGRRITVEERFQDAQGDMIWIETFKAPVLDEDGSVLGTVGIARDISERKAMDAAREAALAEAKRLARLRSEFMARMSHELRTPLNGILGYAQILLAENRLQDREGMMIAAIQRSGEHLLSLINDILDFSKIEAGKQRLSLGNIALPDFLRDLVGIVSIKAEQKRLDFICDMAPELPDVILADETRLRQVLLNLLANAVKYTQQGQVSLRVTASAPGRLYFEVQDTGIGIDSDQLEHIFQPFEQATQGDGTGLGLSISRELVRLMGSDINVSSQVGVGSCFQFELAVTVIAAGSGGHHTLPETASALPPGVALITPPPEEMRILYRLAQEGSMRDIIRQAAHLSELDEGYRPFAEQLQRLAQGYQSKAVLDMVARYIDNTP